MGAIASLTNGLGDIWIPLSALSAVKAKRVCNLEAFGASPKIVSWGTWLKITRPTREVSPVRDVTELGVSIPCGFVRWAAQLLAS